MPTVTVYNTEGRPVGELELSPKVFDAEPNEALIHDAVVQYLANQRVGTAKTKTRGEVRGGGRKPWRQKGLGRARQGSIRAPHWVGGGVVFGPHPREWRQKMPRKARRQALRSALSAKLRAGDIVVLDELTLPEPKTRLMAQVLKNFEADKALLVTREPDAVVQRSSRNLPGVETGVAKDLNVYQVLKYPKMLITRDAVAAVEEVLG